MKRRQPDVLEAWQRIGGVTRGIEYLKRALAEFDEAPAPQTARYIRRALKSAEGAYRHARGIKFEAEQAAKS